MRDQEVLTRAIAKAARNGFEVQGEIRPQFYSHGWDSSMNVFRESIIFSHQFAKAFWGEGDICNWCGSIKFKKEWVDNGYCGGCDTCGDREEHEAMLCAECLIEANTSLHKDNNYIVTWQYHLQQIVLEENPIQYLARFLEEQP